MNIEDQLEGHAKNLDGIFNDQATMFRQAARIIRACRDAGFIGQDGKVRQWVPPLSKESVEPPVTADGFLCGADSGPIFHPTAKGPLSVNGYMDEKGWYATVFVQPAEEADDDNLYPLSECYASQDNMESAQEAKREG